MKNFLNFSDVSKYLFFQKAQQPIQPKNLRDHSDLNLKILKIFSLLFSTWKTF